MSASLTWRATTKQSRCRRAYSPWAAVRWRYGQTSAIPLRFAIRSSAWRTIRTQLNAAILDRDNMEAREAALNPTRRIGAPHDIAAMVAFLASEQASWVNGQNIIVDGGLTALSPQPAYE